MAGSNIYLGNLFGAMIASIGSLVTKMDSQIAKLDSQITALGVINTSVSNTIPSGKIIASANNALVLRSALVANTGVASIEISDAKITSWATGTLRLGATIKSNSGSYTATLSYTLNGGAEVAITANTSSTYTAGSIDVKVNPGDVIRFYTKNANAAGITYVLNDTLIASFTLINVATDGYIVKG